MFRFAKKLHDLFSTRLSLFMLCIFMGFASEGRAENKPSAVSSLFSMNTGEDVDDFISRNPPPQRPVRLERVTGEPDAVIYGLPSLVNGPLTTKRNSLSVIIVYYQVEVTMVRQQKTFLDSSRYNVVEGYVYFPTGQPGQYKRLVIGAIDPQGGEPEVESIFFANADKDPKKELAVLVKWPQSLHVDFSGADYGVFLYDEHSAANSDTLISLSKVQDKLGISSNTFDRDGNALGENRYQTAADVKKILKKMGY